MADMQDIIAQLESLTPASLDDLASFIGYLQWKQAAKADAMAGQPWAFDFVENFRHAVVSADPGPAGMEVKVGEAACEGDWRMALWQHPPVEGAAHVEYQVPVPAGVGDLRLRFATGIRDGSNLAAGNVVAFRIFVDGWKVWSDTQHARPWRDHEIQMPTMAGDVVRIRFVTDGLGNHEWAWAAWGRPWLVGEVTG
jgi:hypothetical protein